MPTTVAVPEQLRAKIEAVAKAIAKQGRVCTPEEIVQLALVRGLEDLVTLAEQKAPRVA